MTRPDPVLPATASVPARPVETDLTTPRKGEAAELPHERDQSVGMTDGEPDERMRQGQRDLERGVADTSKSTETDQAYRKLKK